MYIVVLVKTEKIICEFLLNQSGHSLNIVTTIVNWLHWRWAKTLKRAWHTETPVLRIKIKKESAS
ncbi:hypothetical protein A6A26_16100 [Pantoea sp. OXWO6B1]|nr:hypothetical protein A6A26_16100 [Pantoea sp. OXWO6B1]